jgi:HK97 family phage major capsid protein
MPDVTDFETEIVKLRSAITEKEQQSVTERAKADKLRDDMLSSGVELRSLKAGDDAFEAVDAAYKVSDGLNDEVAAMRSNLDRMYGWTGRTGTKMGGTDPSGPATRSRQTLGQRYIESEVYTRAKDTRLKSLGGPGNGAQINLDGVVLMSRSEFKDAIRMRAGLDLASGQAMVTPEFALIPPVELPVRQVTLIDLIDVQTTDSDAVIWGQQTQRVLAAAPTASGVPAPQATMAFQRVTSNVHRIPVILTVPKEVLADEGRLQGILDKQLMQDTRLSVEYQALAGDGTGENFTGILNAGGIGSYAKTGGDYDLDAIHKGITKVRLSLFQDPDAIGLHPTDLEKIMLQKDNYGRYIFEPSAEQESIWGFKAVSTPVFTEGTGVVGNYRLGATLWLREDVVVTATDGYTDVPTGVNYFSAGLVAIMAQIRAAYAVERPFAFCEITSL